MQGLLRQLVIGGVMEARHKVNWDTTLYKERWDETHTHSLSLSDTHTNSQLAEPIHRQVLSLLLLTQQSNSLSENESEQQNKKRVVQ